MFPFVCLCTVSIVMAQSTTTTTQGTTTLPIYPPVTCSDGQVCAHGSCVTTDNGAHRCCFDYLGAAACGENFCCESTGYCHDSVAGYCVNTFIGDPWTPSCKVQCGSYCCNVIGSYCVSSIVGTCGVIVKAANLSFEVTTTTLTTSTYSGQTTTQTYTIGPPTTTTTSTTTTTTPVPPTTTYSIFGTTTQSVPQQCTEACALNHQTVCCPFQDQFACCPFPNGVCCWDYQSCCPQYSQCGRGGQCFPNNVTASMSMYEESNKVDNN